MQDDAQLAEEVDKIKRSEKDSSHEEFSTKVIVSRNTHKEKNKTFMQYKMNLPKEFMDVVSNGGKNIPQTKGIFDSSKNKLIIEIW